MKDVVPQKFIQHMSRQFLQTQGNQRGSTHLTPSLCFPFLHANLASTSRRTTIHGQRSELSSPPKTWCLGVWLIFLFA